jgi:hypothetical protein
MSIQTPYLPRIGNGPSFDTGMITADGPTLMRQGAMTANDYLHSAIDHIDAALGKGYAKAHPELIGAFMQAATADLGAAAIARAVQGIAPAIDGAAEALRDAVAEISSPRRALRAR